jgi:hypothetical protein
VVFKVHTSILKKCTASNFMMLKLETAGLSEEWYPPIWLLCIATVKAEDKAVPALN